MSSSRPTNGLTYAAPALATSSAWLGEKHSVMLILIPCPLRHLHAFTPSRVVGSFTTTCSFQPAKSWPSRHMAPASVPTTSTLTGPPTILQISSTVGLNGLPSLAMSVGLVVTPSKTPSAAASRISPIFPVSKKIFIAFVLGSFSCLFRAQRESLLLLDSMCVRYGPASSPLCFLRVICG